MPMPTKPSGAPGIVDEPDSGELSLPPFTAYVGII
jgi:hypothetical protein